MKQAPWKDFKGNNIHVGDTIIHPDGDKGIVRYKPVYQLKEDNWMVDYGNFVSRLCLQIGDKGQAVVEKKKIKKDNMKPDELKELRESFDFTQKQMADILGIHPNALQRMEYGTSPIPKYIRNYASCLTTLNENKLFRKHIKLIGVDVGEKTPMSCPRCTFFYEQVEKCCPTCGYENW